MEAKTIELVKLDPKKFGLEETKASEIRAAFTPMLDKMVALESEYNEIVNLEISDATCQRAKELRLRYVKVRTGTAKIHKKMKAFYLAGGRFVDGWKNAQLFASQGIEKMLHGIENYYEIQEQQRIDKIYNEREVQLRQYLTPGMEVPANLGTLPDAMWHSFVTGAKAVHRAHLEEKAKEISQMELRAQNAELKAKADAAENENAKLRALVPNKTTEMAGEHLVFLKGITEPKLVSNYDHEKHYSATIERVVDLDSKTYWNGEQWAPIPFMKL